MIRCSFLHFHRPIQNTSIHYSSSSYTSEVSNKKDEKEVEIEKLKEENIKLAQQVNRYEAERTRALFYMLLSPCSRFFYVMRELLKGNVVEDGKAGWK